MNIKCPKCHKVIESNNINVEKDYAFCDACNEVFSVSKELSDDFGLNPPHLMSKVMNNPPKGTWKHEDMNNVIIGASTRSPIAFFMVPFMIVWTGGSVGVLYGQQVISGEFDPFLSLFGVPFIIGSVIFWSLALMAIAGKVEVVIGADSYVFTGLGKIGKKKKFNWNSIIRIYENVPDSQFNINNYGRAIFLEGETRIKFGSGLNEKRRYYLVTVLKYMHSKKKNYFA